MFIDIVFEGAAEGTLAEFYQQQKSAWGFLPNFAVVFSPRPEVAKAWSMLNKTVRDGMDQPPLRDHHHRRRPGAALGSGEHFGGGAE